MCRGCSNYSQGSQYTMNIIAECFSYIFTNYKKMTIKSVQTETDSIADTMKHHLLNLY